MEEYVEDNKPTQMSEYKIEFKQLQDMINSHPGSGTPQFWYEIYYCNFDSDQWKQAEWKPEKNSGKQQDPKNFIKRINSILNTYDLDAVQVKIGYKNTTKIYNVRIDKKQKIKLLDDKESIEHKDRPGDVQTKKQPEPLNGTEQPHASNPVIKDGGLGALGQLQLENYMKNFDLKTKEEKIKEIQEKYEKEKAEYEKVIAELTKEIEELEDENEEHEKIAQRMDMMKLGLLGGIQLIGSKLGINTAPLMGLAGTLFGGGDSPAQIEGGDPNKGGGLETETDPRIEAIISYLKSVNEETMQKLLTILQVLEKRPDIIDNVGNYTITLSNQPKESKP